MKIARNLQTADEYSNANAYIRNEKFNNFFSSVAAVAAFKSQTGYFSSCFFLAISRTLLPTCSIED